MRWLVLATVVAAACGGNLHARDPYAPRDAAVLTTNGPSGIPDVRCAADPVTGPARGFRHARHAIVTALATPGHRGIDLVAADGADQVVRGQLGYGLVDKALEDEDVELFACASDGWHPLGRARSDGDGRFALALAGDARLPAGLRDLYVSVVADRSGARFVGYVAPAGARVIVADVDGTLTASESAFPRSLVLGGDVAAQGGAAEALQHAAATGAQIVYVTARGSRFTAATRHWLATHGFPRGPLRLAPSLVTMPGAATVAYKRGVLRELAAFSIAAALGNRASDVAAYRAAGVPRVLVKLPEFRGELATALRAGAATGFARYTALPAL